MNGSWIKNPADLIIRHEGSGPMRDGAFMPYRDSLGFLTIGYGWNLDANGIPPAIAQTLLALGVTRARRICADIFDNFEELDFLRQCALIDMAFNLGERLGQFHDMIVAINAKDWPEAAHQALASKWAKQVGSRATDDADLLRGEPA